MKLADDVAIPASTQNWSYNNSIATLKKTTTEGYQLSEDGMSISYYTAKTDTLLTVNGVKSADGLELNDTLVKVPAAVLNEKKVTISDGYSLALAEDVTQSKTSENWSYSNAVATYRKIITPGYTLSEDESSITYSTNEDDITVNVKGVKSKNGLSIDGTTVTVATPHSIRKQLQSMKATTSRLPMMLLNPRRQIVGATAILLRRLSGRQQPAILLPMMNRQSLIPSKAQRL